MTPDKPGFYWYLDFNDQPAVAEITVYPDDPTLKVWETGCEAGDTIEQYRWLGPVEPYRESSFPSTDYRDLLIRLDGVANDLEQGAYEIEDAATVCDAQKAIRSLLEGREVSSTQDNSNLVIGPMGQIVPVVDDWYADVLAFHRKFAPTIIGDSPSKPTFDCYDIDFIAEELEEIRLASDRDDIPSVADGLVDLIYVACRMAIIWGIDLRPVWRVVHAANIAKVGGDVRGDFKVMKPPGWTPPDVAGELRKQGWEG